METLSTLQRSPCVPWRRRRPSCPAATSRPGRTWWCRSPGSRGSPIKKRRSSLHITRVDRQVGPYGSPQPCLRFSPGVYASSAKRERKKVSSRPITSPFFTVRNVVLDVTPALSILLVLQADKLTKVDWRLCFSPLRQLRDTFSTIKKC